MHRALKRLGSLSPTVVGFSFALALAVAIVPSSLQAQGVSLGVRAGSTGVGGDVIVGLTSKLGLRAGLGVLPFKLEQDLDGDLYSIEPPPLFGMAALDVNLFGPIRVMGGLLYRSDDIVFSADVTGGRDIGGTYYKETGRLEGALTSASVAPFVGLGLGRVIGSGIGFYIDLGVAFTGAPGLDLAASGPITSLPGFDEDFEAERVSLEADVKDVYRYWPMLNLGLSIGFGR